ncbi:MAG: PQQ-like beta-propeller repeat protein [Bacteroidales bacterium]|nr:PQQ-like beta-propeller repeat protein [Bacteroidales bacterium]
MRLLVATIITITFFIQCTSKQEIAQWRGSNRDGIYLESNLLTQWSDSGPRLLWQYDSLGQGYASAAVISNRVYTIGTVDSISYIFTFDTDGNLLWRKKLGLDWIESWPGIRSTPTIYNGFGYVLNGLGDLYCFNADNGDIIWQKNILKVYNGRNLDWGMSENLMIEGNYLFCTPGGIDNNVVALNRNTGETIWTSKGNSDTAAYCTPILIDVRGKKYFVNQTRNSIISLNAENGEIAWKYPLSNAIHPSTPYYRDGYLFATDGIANGSMQLKISEDGRSVSEVWRNSDFNAQYGHTVVLGNRIYGVCSFKKTFSCIDWNTGKEIYSDSIKVAPITTISDGRMLYCYFASIGEVKLIKPTENGFENRGHFTIKGSKKGHFAHPVIKDGRLYVRHENSLFVYDIAKK